MRVAKNLQNRAYKTMTKERAKYGLKKEEGLRAGEQTICNKQSANEELV
jgi:hypothetical protein